MYRMWQQNVTIFRSLLWWIGLNVRKLGNVNNKMSCNVWFLRFKTSILLVVLVAQTSCVKKPIFSSPGMRVNKTVGNGAMSNHTACSKSRWAVSEGSVGVWSCCVSLRRWRQRQSERKVNTVTHYKGMLTSTMRRHAYHPIEGGSVAEHRAMYLP